MVRHSAGWTEQAAGTHIQWVSSTIRPLTSSQTTEQPFLPSWGQGKKTAGFPPSCGPGLRTPLGVRQLCVLTSSATGWSEKLPWLTRECLAPAWQALTASMEQHINYDFTGPKSPSMHSPMLLATTAGAVHGKHQGRPSDDTLTWNPLLALANELTLFINLENVSLVIMGETAWDSQHSPQITLFFRTLSDSWLKVKLM